MYERSAIVLENYFNKLLGLDNSKNLRTNYDEYAQMIDKIKEYQRVMQEEEKIIQKFDEAAKQIESIQKKEQSLHEENINLENQRDKMFNDLDENPSILYQKLEKIEQKLDDNNNSLKEQREEYIKSLVIFTERQKERNKYTRMHRTEETGYLNYVKQVIKDFDDLDVNAVKQVKDFISDDKKKYIQEIANIMLKNGRNEKVQFDKTAIENAANARMEIAQEEANIYISVYERMKKLLIELNNGNVKLSKSEKLLRDSSCKLNFLKAKKEYIISFLDNERITAMNGKLIHEELMKEACRNFVVDIKQINNLYELINRETAGKATKKSYKELYNKTYLQNIQEKEIDFNKEITNIKINMGTVINSNYWRIEGIKNVYNTFQNEVSEKFNKDLSEYKIDNLEDNQHTEKSSNAENKNQIKNDRSKNSNDEDYEVEGFIEDIDEDDNNDSDDYDYNDENDDEDYIDDFDDSNYDEDDYIEDDDDYDDEGDDIYDDEEDDDYYDGDEYFDDYNANEKKRTKNSNTKGSKIDDEDDDGDFEDVEFDEEEERALQNRNIREDLSKKKKKQTKEEKSFLGKLFGK